eukprot:SAG31_NODE_632_length_13389_cov_4.818360_1_plen_141_part_00
MCARATPERGGALPLDRACGPDAAPLPLAADFFSMGCGASSATGTLTGRAAVHEVVVDSAGVAHVSATTLDMERGDAKSADAESATAEPTALEGDSFEAPEEAHAMMEISAIVEADSQARLKVRARQSDGSSWRLRQRRC